MAITRIKTNQITDLNVTTAKIANNAVTGAKLANNLSYGSDFTVTGNLTVSGTTTSVSTTNTRVEDAIIALSAEATGSASVDSGLLINRGDDDNYALIWDESEDQFVAANVGSEDGDTAGNVTISSYANFRAGTITYATLNDGSNAITSTAAEINLIDGSSAGTIVNSKAVIYGSSGEVNATTLQIGGSSITATAAELNIMDGDTSATATTVAAADRVVLNDNGTMVQAAVTDLDTFFISTTQTLSNKTINSDSNTLTLDLSEGTLTGTTAEFNSALSDGSFATLAGTETLTNKTISADNNTISGIAASSFVLSNGSGNIDGSASQKAIPSGVVVGTTDTQTLTNKTIDSASNTLTLDLSEGTLTGTTSEFNSALSDGSFATLAGTETLTNKTLTAPKIADAGFIADANGNELVIFQTTASAVNQFDITNAGTSGHPDIAATGDDTNINISLSPKGSGTVDVNTSKIVNVTDPTSNQDAATKAYVDTQVSAASDLTIGADSGSDDTVTIGSDTLNFVGTANEIETTVSNNQIQIGLPDDVTIGGDATITGNLTVNGTTTTLSTTNSVVSDALIELNNGASSNANDLGFIFERGSTGDNAAIIWDESADIFQFGTTTATGASTGDLTVTDAGIRASTADFGGNVTVDGNLDLSAGSGTITTNVSDTHVLFSVSGVITGEAGFTYDDSGNELTVPSIIVSDLTDNRVAIAGTSGALEDSANLTFDGSTLTVTGATDTTSLSVGGGFGSTGVSISNAGVIQANGAISSDGAITGGSITDGTATLSSGNITGGVAATFSGAGTFGSLVVGGGYGDTGVSISAAGVLQANGAITSDGAVTGGSLTDGTATFSSGALTGATTGAFSSNLTVNGNIDISGGSGTITTNVADTHMLYSVSGVITGEAGFTYNQTSNELTIPSATVSDLTSGRIVTAGTSGALQDSGTLLWDGTDLTAGSAIISDLTSGRVVLAGTSGALEDSGNLTFDGSTLALTGAMTSSGNISIADAGSLRVGTGNDFTINHDGTDTAITNGTGILKIDGTATSSIRVNEAGANVDFVVEGDSNTGLLTVDASQDNVGIGGAPNANAILDVNDTGAILLARGTTAQRPTAVTGMFRYNTTSNTLEYYSNTAWTGISSDFTLATSQTFSGDNSTVAFTLSSLSGADSYTVAGVLVMLNGVVQEPTTVYGISGTTLTFTTAPASGDLIEVRKFTTTTTVTAITDSDGDTQIQVEESADEDIIRFDIGGSEKMVLNSTQLSVTGNIVATGDITANGDITLGDGNTDTITLGAEIGSDIIPDTDGSRDLGSATNRWAEAHIDDVLLGPQGDIRFYDSDASNFVAFQSGGTVASNITWTLPTADASVSGYALVSDASGTLSWAAAGATTTSDTSTNAEEQLYFSDITSGAVTAVHHDADLTYNPSTGSLTSAIFKGALIIPDGGNIGSASDTDAIAISSGGNVTMSQNLTVTGNFTVNGTTTTVNTTNMVVSDNLIELNNGASSNANDSGIVIERGSTGDNAFMGWDESADKFVFGTTTATGASTGNLTISSGTVVANTFEGALSGNATTATTLATTRAIEVSGAVTGTANFDGSAAINIVTTATSDPVITLTGAVTGSGTMTNLGDVSIATTATADPTLTLAGDASGSATFTNLGNATLTVTVADDSHNHTIANVDGLQAELDGKLTAGATSGSGISGSASSGTFTVTSNATNANTGSTIVFRDGSGNFSAGTITANLTGNASGSSGSCTGNSATATLASTVTISANNSANETVYLTFVDGATGTQGLETDTGLSYNPSTNILSTTASSARYADLAEMYAADAEIEPGTVVHFAGEGKLAACDTENCRTVAGIVSTDPAHLMNSEQEGVALALAGRVPCKVTGAVSAGDLMVSAGNGMAMANNNAAIGTVIGKAIEAHEGGEGVIEVLALMM